MRNLWPILLVFLWTNPSTNIDGSPCVDLRRIIIEGVQESYPNARVVFDFPLWEMDDLGNRHYRSHAGDPDSAHVTPPAPRVAFDWWNFQAFAVDDSSNYSGGSNVVRVNLGVGSPTTGLDPTPLLSGMEEWYDVHGRRIERPIASGVYFRRRGSVTEKVIILK